MYTEKYCDAYYTSLIALNPTYVWGANMEKVSAERINELYKTYGSKQYNAAYYQSKLAEANAGSGWISDCSGMIFPISQKDNTAKGYYAACPEKGGIATIDLSHSCLVFRGTTPTTISHIGYYCASTGEVMEMASSKTNFQHKRFNHNNWNYWGKPSFIQYEQGTNRPYLYKGIDVSSYQKNIDYGSCKSAGVDFAILKVIRKDLNKDKMFEAHWQGFKSVGIPVFGVYNYSYATTVAKAESDAKRVIEYLAGRKCAVCLDVEDKCQKGLGMTLINIINAYQNVIEAAGLPFLLYTGLSFYNSYIKPYTSSLRCKNLWIARYYKGYNAMDFKEDPNAAYKPMKNLIGWQYTSSGHLPGCPGSYDLNVIYADINSVKATAPATTPAAPVAPKNTVITAKVVTKGSNLNVRNKPKTGQVLRRLSNGSTVNIFGVDPTTGWLRLSATKEEWVSPDYIKGDK